MRIVECDIEAEHTASDEEQACLSLFAGEMVYRFKRVWAQRDRLIAEDVRLPIALFPGLSRQDICARIGVLAHDYGLLLGDATERMTNVVATEGIAKALAIPKGTIVLKLDRVVHLIDGRPVEWRTTFIYGCASLTRRFRSGRARSK